MTEFPQGDEEQITGFTLVEMATVLVIIGLVIGGVLVGRDLILHSQVHKVVSDLGKFEIAYQMFSERYNGVPGDLARSDAIFGSSCSGGGGTTESYSGNGDGIIDAWPMGTWEAQKVWCQLNYSGIFPNSYLTTESIPVTYLNQVSFIIPLSHQYCPFDGNCIMLSSSDDISGAGFSPVDAQAIDSKMDDGLPNRGLIQADGSQSIWAAGYPGSQNCGNSYDAWNPQIPVTNYNIQSSLVTCRLLFSF